jgi:hypothetical protein
MSMTIYTPNQNDSVMTNTDMSTIPRSPDSLSQASTKFEPRPTTNENNPDSPDNPANDVNRPVPGWPTLAKVMAQTPDFEAFASFKDLSIKSLLYYQAELIYLRKSLHKLEWEDYRQSDLVVNSSFANDLTTLIEARDDSIANKKPDRPVELPQQWVLIEKIRSTLDKYSKRFQPLEENMTDSLFSRDSALLQFSEVAALRDADKCNAKTLKGCVKRAGRDRVALTGDGAFTWGDYNESSSKQKSIPQLFWGLFTGFFVSPDGKPKEQKAVYLEHLIVPRPGNPPDGLTLWVTRSFIPFYDQLTKKHPVPIWENHEKYKKYVLPFWAILVLLGLILDSLWHAFLLICRKLLAKVPSHDEEKETQKRWSNTSSSSGTSSQASTDRTNSDASKSLEQCETIKKGLTAYSGLWILRVTSIMTTTVACLLPTVAITVLAKVHSMGLILGLIALFTALFAIGLALLSSSSSRVDIFTASAA